MTPQVLILSGLYDFSTDLVVLKLERAGIRYVRLNREQLAGHRLTLDPLVPELTIRGPSGDHRVGPDLVSVWFRQPVFLRNTPPTPLSPAEQLERSQWTAFLRALCVFRNAGWMNFPMATYIAESKPYQLYVAADCDFSASTTLATNDAARIRNSFPGRLVIKSLDTVLLRDGNECLFTYTTFNSGTELTDETVRAVPLLAQFPLEKKTDLRVTVVGEELFAVRVLSNGTGIDGDWRLVSKSELEFEDVELEAELAARCRELTRQLGLAFAAIDLIETAEGISFIEINPTGEWGWLSSAERPIDGAIASWLKNPVRR